MSAECFESTWTDRGIGWWKWRIVAKKGEFGVCVLEAKQAKNIFWSYRSCKFLPGRELGIFVGQHRKNLPVFCHFVVDKCIKVGYTQLSITI